MRQRTMRSFSLSEGEMSTRQRSEHSRSNSLIHRAGVPSGRPLVKGTTNPIPIHPRFSRPTSPMNISSSLGRGSDFSNRPMVFEADQITGESTRQQPPSIPPRLHVSDPSSKHYGNKISNYDSLLQICMRGDEASLRNLIKSFGTRGIPVSLLNGTNTSGRTGLSFACSAGNVAMVDILSKIPSCDINKPDIEGNTPLHHAVQAGFFEVMKILISIPGCDIDARNLMGITPLMKAALQGRNNCIKCLLEAGASPYLRDYSRGFTAAEWAKFCGRHVCSETISNHSPLCSSAPTRTRWSDEIDRKVLEQHVHKEGWFKSKFLRAFRHDHHSKKEYGVTNNLAGAAVMASSPILHGQNYGQKEFSHKKRDKRDVPRLYVSPCSPLPARSLKAEFSHRRMDRL